MNELKLLIVDDVEDNRLILKAICQKLDGFEIREASDGIEAIESVEAWHPHIVLMDVMMPRLDGFEASKIIKARYPETVIMVVTAVMDPHMETNMAQIGVGTYIHKPVDKELIRFKLKSFGDLIRSKEGNFKKLSPKDTLNPFCTDIRHFKTIFDISDAEAMMDFGMWILSQCEQRMTTSCHRVDSTLELLYELMRHSTRDKDAMSIIVEESFEEIFVTMKFDNPIHTNLKITGLIDEMGDDCVLRENIACIRIRICDENKPHKTPIAQTIQPIINAVEAPVKHPVNIVEPVVETKPVVEAVAEVAKVTRVIDTEEKELLRQSFVHKTAAVDYVRDIGGDVLDEIRDLESLDEEWGEKLRAFESEPTVANLHEFADGVLGIYVRGINNLFEFTALAYALSSLGAFLKEHAESVAQDNTKVKTLVMLLEHLGLDLVSWREHIFALQDTGDIHYLDSSFFSSCMQIEGIIGDKELDVDDDNDMEFF